METILVFVHLGVKLPRYLVANISRTKALFPDLRVLLIGDSLEVLASAATLGVDTYLHDVEVQDNSTGSFGYSQAFRGGFWSATKNRLFALADWHVRNEDLRVLHLESDVMVFRDFPWENFESLGSLAWLKVNHDHDCAAILYSPNGVASKWLSERLREEVAEDASVTDMVALSRIRKRSPASIYLLPTWSRNWPNGNSDHFKELCNDSAFPGIFDAATLGMWLLGRDPRNHRGFTKFLMDTPEHLVDATVVDFEPEGFDRLQVSVSGIGKSLYNLHVHSKNPRALGQPDSRELSMRIWKARNHQPYGELSLLAAMTSLIETLQSIFNRQLIPNGILRLKELVGRRGN